jgi:hypothetical protein
MTYLDIARSAVVGCEISEKRLSLGTFGLCEGTLECEKSEKSEIRSEFRASDSREPTSGCEESEIGEKSPNPELAVSLLTPDGAEVLKARIIAVVSVNSATFDRAEYDRLTACWNAYETGLAQHGADSSRPANEV